MMENPQAVAVGAKLGRRLNLVLLLPAARRSPDPVAFFGGVLAAIAGGSGAAIGTQTTAELLRIALGRLEGTPQLALPPGVRLAVAAAEASAAIEAGTGEALEAPEPDPIKATDEEKARAFEWLRNVALGHGAEARAAGIMLQQVVQLKALQP